MMLVSEEMTSWNSRFRISRKMSKQNPYWILVHWTLRNILLAPVFNWKNTPLKIKMDPKNKGLEDDFTTSACFLRIQADCRSSSIGGTPLKLNLLWSVIWGWQQRYGLPRQASHHLLWTWTSTWRHVFPNRRCRVPCLVRNFNLIEGPGTKRPVSMMPVFRISSKVIPGSHLREGTCKQDSWLADDWCKHESQPQEDRLWN